MRALTLDLDDRRELWRLLDKLTPRQRVRFLQRECQRVRNRGKVRVTYSTGLTGECYLDLLQLEVVFGLNLHEAACRLEKIVRKGH